MAHRFAPTLLVVAGKIMDGNLDWRFVGVDFYLFDVDEEFTRIDVGWRLGFWAVKYRLRQCDASRRFEFDANGLCQIIPMNVIQGVEMEAKVELPCSRSPK